MHLHKIHALAFINIFMTVPMGGHPSGFRFRIQTVQNKAPTLIASL